MAIQRSRASQAICLISSILSGSSRSMCGGRGDAPCFTETQPHAILKKDGFEITSDIEFRHALQRYQL